MINPQGGLRTDKTAATSDNGLNPSATLRTGSAQRLNGLNSQNDSTERAGKSG
jgi:hypothetical protein